MPTPNYHAINATRDRALRRAESARISQVAGIATALQRMAPELTRSAALRSAERIVPHVGGLSA